MNEAASYWSSVPHHPTFSGVGGPNPSPATDTHTGNIFSSLLYLFKTLEKNTYTHRLSANAKHDCSLRSILVLLSNYRGMY